MKINGTWKSSAGSTLEINESDGKISGTFQLGKDTTGKNTQSTGALILMILLRYARFLSQSHGQMIMETVFTQLQLIRDN